MIRIGLSHSIFLSGLKRMQHKWFGTFQAVVVSKDLKILGESARSVYSMHYQVGKTKLIYAKDFS